MDVMLVIAIVGLALICCGVSVKIAAGKGRAPVLWGLVGLFLNLLGLLVVVVLPRHRTAPAPVSTTGSEAPPHGARTAVA